mgnify:CR=1 FL=1
MRIFPYQIPAASLGTHFFLFQTVSKQTKFSTTQNHKIQEKK